MGKAKTIVSAAAMTALVCSLAPSGHAAQGVEENMLLELKKLIEQQQQQLDNQSKEIAKLQEQLGGATAEIEKKADKEEVAKLETGQMVTSKFEHVDVSLYGHLNRGVLWSDNGDSSKAFFVDNANSQSRLGLTASVAPSENITVGGRIEYGLSTNSTNDVSQNDTNGATSGNWNLRWADISLGSKTIGKASLGHGSTASDGTSEIDFSGTGVVTYSDVEALSGGQLWYNDRTNTLTDVRVKNVFNNMDGLGRDDRLRYDSPSFGGFSFSTSAVSGDAYDAVIRYSREYGDTKVAAAVAWASPGDAIASVDNQYNGSISVLLGNGLNATFAAGGQDFREDARDDATTWYGKLGYQMDVCSLGKTSLSVDYGEHKDIMSNNEKGKTWSIAAVQDIPSWGTEFYLAYRNYKLDSDGGLYDVVNPTSFDDVNAILGGARVKF